VRTLIILAIENRLLERLLTFKAGGDVLQDGATTGLTITTRPISRPADSRP
jgi:hypothetical protein